MARRKKTTSPECMAVVHPDAGAVDIGARMHVAVVASDRDETSVRTFEHSLATYMRSPIGFSRCGITTVGMESIGINWIPAFEILEQRGFDVVLVIAAMPPRPLDAKPMSVVLSGCSVCTPMVYCARASPAGEITVLRVYLRQRERLLHYAASHIQYMQKALSLMNLQLQQVVTDITGATGLRLIWVIRGERDPTVLAGCAMCLAGDLAVLFYTTLRHGNE